MAYNIGKYITKNQHQRNGHKSLGPELTSPVDKSSQVHVQAYGLLTIYHLNN